MKSKRFLQKAFLIFVLMVALFVLAACSGKEQAKEPSIPSTKFVSSTELFSLYVPTGWSIEEVIPGADLVMANSDAALGRFTSDGIIESGDVVLNVGFLPLALLQEKELSHLGFQYEASPDVFLQSLLPMFHLGDKPAGSAAGDVMLVSLGDERDAGMLTFSEEKREGSILVFTAGNDVFAFISATTFPGGMGEFQEITYAVAAGIAYSGSQNALYQKLYGD
ncbi:MAG: hypothetical protein P8X95_10895 [Anaerolineales bacterium]|jgi:hypothetical protein